MTRVVHAMSEQEFCALFPHMTNAEMAVLSGLTEDQVKRRARQLRLYKTPEQRGKVISARNAGRPKSAETREKIRRALSGRTLPPEHVENMRRAAKASSNVRRAERHPCWKGGRPWSRFVDPAYVAWRNAVLKRDGYVCQRCGHQCKPKERGLTAHHIKPWAQYPALRLELRNGETLCDACHRAHHGTRRRKPSHIPCACGCGTLIPRYRTDGKPRRFAHGSHWGRTPEARATRWAKKHDEGVACAQSISPRRMVQSFEEAGQAVTHGPGPRGTERHEPLALGVVDALPVVKSGLACRAHREHEPAIEAIGEVHRTEQSLRKQAPIGRGVQPPTDAVQKGDLVLVGDAAGHPGRERAADKADQDGESDLPLRRNHERACCSSSWWTRANSCSRSSTSCSLLCSTSTRPVRASLLARSSSSSLTCSALVSRLTVFCIKSAMAVVANEVTVFPSNWKVLFQ